MGIKHASAQMKCDAIIQLIENDKTRIEIDIIKYKSNKVDADQLKQKYADMCERATEHVDKFEKEYEGFPTLILKLMKETDTITYDAKILIKCTLGEYP